jgi:hypothetical protein
MADWLPHCLQIKTDGRQIYVGEVVNGLLLAGVRISALVCQSTYFI